MKKKTLKKAGFIFSMFIILTSMILAVIQPAKIYASDDKTANLDGFSAKLIADPDTSSNNTIFNGSPAEDGKIWTDKSVTTGTLYGATASENNFNIALSAMAQTYSTVSVGMSTTQQKIGYDVVFVLDFSGSMADHISGSRTSKATAMVNAVNSSIQTLMEDENNRVGIVGYSGENAGNENNAETLFPLDRYSTDSNENKYLEYTNNSIRAARRSNLGNTTYYVKNSSSIPITSSKEVSGGTPTQRGIYHGMEILNSTEKTDDIIRLPILVLLSDGAAGSAKSDYIDPKNGTLYQGNANGGYNNNDDAEVGAYTILTANHAKKTLDTHYKGLYDYSNVLSDSSESVAKFYTIGLGINNTDWTHFMLDPSTTATDSNNTVREIKTILNRDDTYKNNYKYTDKYFGGSMSEEDLENAFKDILSDMTVAPSVNTEINNPVSSESGGGDIDSFVTFTDYLGYKMELKGNKQYLRYQGINYVFEKQENGTYKFNGTTQDGTIAGGPIANDGSSLNDVIFKVEKDNELVVNGQTGYNKITWSFPSALLPTYSRTNDYDKTAYPIRMLYEVGLEEDASLFSGLEIDSEGKPNNNFTDYAFYTNLYDFETGNSYSNVEFKPAKDNPYYYKIGYTTDKEAAATTTEYLKVDMPVKKAQPETEKGTADIKLEDIRLSLNPGQMSFTYDGNSYTVALSGNAATNALWSGETTITVKGTADDTGETIEANARINVSAIYSRQSWNNYYLSLDSITINDTEAVLSNDKTAADATILIEKSLPPTTSNEEEIVSVYMELKQDINGYYIEDSNGNRINVVQSGDRYMITIGKNSYHSNIYYKYSDGIIRYRDKDLPKGNIAKSFVGQLEIIQPQNGEKIDENNFKDYFIYHSADGSTITNATGILFSDGSFWGNVSDTDSSRPPVGSFKVCIDDITNKNNEGIRVNFDFIVEEQTIIDGIKYNAADVSFFEKESKHSIDIHIANIPTISESGNYLYDVSYTIIDANPETGDNKTCTDERFFQSTLNNDVLTSNLGNNGRMTISIKDNAYEKEITVNKNWIDKNGELLTSDNNSLSNVSATIGLYQTYEYIDDDNKKIIASIENEPYKIVELNQENAFSYTWNKYTLPRYLVNSGGDYILDNKENKVEITYVVNEITATEGWITNNTAKTEDDNALIFTITNQPNLNLTPTVTKVWTQNGETTEAPEGYKVKVELLADGKTVTNIKKEDRDHKITAILEQKDESSDAVLKVKYGEKDLKSQNVTASEIKENGSKIYTFKYDEPTGTPGAGNYASKAEIRITIADTYGGKLGISDAKTAYFVEDKEIAVLSPSSSIRNEDSTSKTVIFTMKYVIDSQDSSVILDGSEEWFYTWIDWDLPTLVKDDNGEYKQINYSIKETLIDSNGNEYSPDENELIKVSDNEVYKATIGNDNKYNFTITNDRSLTSVSVTKKWIDNNDAYQTRPDTITFELFADDTKLENQTKTISSSDPAWNGESITWDNLPVYNNNGNKIKYTVSETMGALPNDQYVTTIENNNNNFTITNRLDDIRNLTSMTVEKQWIDDNDAQGKRPEEISMVLYRRVDGSTDINVVPDSPLIKLTNEKLKGSWDNLPKYNNEGKKYVYSVKEYEHYDGINTPKEGVTGYSDISNDKNETKYTFINQLDNGKVNKTVTKVWKDAALKDQRPDTVTIELSAKTTNGDIVDLNKFNPIQELTEKNKWTYTWKDLPEFINGMKVDYTINEIKVNDTAIVNNQVLNYQVDIKDDGAGDGFTITNTLIGKTTVTIEKQWQNQPSDFVIPEISFDIIANEISAVETLTITKDNSKVTSHELNKYDTEGKIINYTIKEENLNNDNYNIDSSISENSATDGSFIYKVTNTYVPLTREVSVTKTWNGLSPENLPDNITIALYRKTSNSKNELVKEVTPEWSKTGTTWTYVFKDLAVYQDRNNYDTEYIYSIEETAIDDVEVEDNKAGDFTVSYSSNNNEKLNIINTLGGTVDGSSLEGTKNWVDVEKDNIPDRIEIQLYRNIENGNLEPAIDTNGNDVFKTIDKKDQSNVTVWSFNFNGITLPKYDADGNEYTYSVKEISVTADNTTLKVENNAVGDYIVDENGLNITNTLKQDDKNKDMSGTYPVIKNWINANGHIPESITIQLEDNNSDKGAPVQLLKDNQTNETEWNYTFTGLRKYSDNGISPYNLYKAKETKINDIDVNNERVRDFTIKYVQQDGEKTIINNTLVSDNDKATISYPVKKHWDNIDDDNLPENITIQLEQNNETYGDPVVLTNDTNWQHKFDNLREYQDDGLTPYEYSVKEIKVRDLPVINNRVGDYEVSISGGTITNTHVGDEKIELFDLPIRKEWKNVSENNLPNSITIQLIQNGNNYGDAVTLTKDTNWQYTFTNIPKYQANGIIENFYSVIETHINNISIENTDYEFSYNDHVLTNTLKDPQNITVTGTKIWKDDNNKLNIRPENITVALLADEKEIDSKLVTGTENEWKFEFTDLNKYNPDGSLIKYTVKEKNDNKPSDYTMSQDGNVITNTLTGGNKYPVNQIIAINKIWNDRDNLEKYRPNEIKVHLNEHEVILNQDNANNYNNWSTTLKVPTFDENGIMIEYNKVSEDPISHYLTTYAGNKDDGFTITNTFTAQDVISITVTKNWLDNNNAYSTRPNGVEIELLQDGLNYENMTITTKDNWQHTFMNLPRVNAEGKVHEYVVKEINIAENYLSTIDQYQITNTLAGETVVAGTKLWKNVSDENLPNNVTIALLQNSKVIKEMNVSKDTNWKYEFNNLDKYDPNGVEYTYAVMETAIDGKAINDTDYEVSNIEGTFDLLNTLVDKKDIIVSGQKIWVDNDNQYNTRPESIVVTLYADGKEINSQVVSANKNWKYEFNGLSKYDQNGKTIIYTVTEAAVDGYNTVINGYNIINTLDHSRIPNDSGNQNPDTSDPTMLNAYTIMLFASSIGSAFLKKKKYLR